MPEGIESREMEVQRHGMMFLFTTVGITVAGFFATMFYAHWVGAEILGIYFLFLSYYGILTLFTDSGVGYAGVKRISEGKDQDAFYTASLMLRVLLYGLTIAVFVIFQNRFVDLNQSGLFWVLIVIVGLDIINAQMGTSIAGCNRLGLSASSNLLNNLFRIGTQVFLVYAGYRLFGLIGGLIAGILIQIAVQSRFVDLHLRRFTLSHIRNLFTYSIWAFLTSSGSVVFEYIDVLVIGYFMAVSDVGIYGVCWNFSSCAIFIALALSNALFVKVSRWSSAGERDAIAVSLSLACTYSLIFAIPLLVGGVLLGGPLLYYFYGATFASGLLTLIILFIMRTIQSLQQIFFTFLMGVDQAQKAFSVTLVMAIANLGLDIFLVPAWGIVGAAIASLLTIGMSTVYAYFQISGIIPTTFDWRSIGHVLLAATVMGASILLMDRIIPRNGASHALVLVVMGALVYFLVLVVIDPDVRRAGLQIFRIKWNP
jgi:O-antigen/teichoic acid export membrane protein